MKVCKVFFLSGLMILALLAPESARTEWYVGPQAGVTFADRLVDVNGTGSFFGLTAPDFDLKNSIAYGAKLGYFPGSSWFGIELDVYNTTPHIKSLDDIPGIHMRVTTAAVNIIARYPGLTFQPYVGVGLGLMFAHIGDSPTTRADSDVGAGLNALVGMRFFVTPYTALFTEYKYSEADLAFDNAFSPAQGFASGGFSGTYRAQHIVVGILYHF
ncbi:MAG: porin family protein [Nitrospirae bacterium]|nr:MAG: porin family protein [Nitrospirota bacterium]